MGDTVICYTYRLWQVATAKDSADKLSQRDDKLLSLEAYGDEPSSIGLMRNLVGVVYHAAHVSQLFYVFVAHVCLDYCIQPCFVQVLVIGFASLFSFVLDDVLFFVVVAHFVVMVATFISGKLRSPSGTAGVDASVLSIGLFHIQSVLIFLQSNDTYI